MKDFTRQADEILKTFASRVIPQNFNHGIYPVSKAVANALSKAYQEGRNDMQKELEESGVRFHP